MQYTDTIDNKPPLLAWFYAAFVWAFGGAALTAVRIFTCLYLFLAAVSFNGLVLRSRINGQFSILPGFFLALLCCVPWYAQELNGEILLMLPMITCFGLLTRLQDGEEANPDQRLFTAGLLLGIAFMIKYQAVFLFLGFFIAYLIILAPRLRDEHCLILQDLLGLVRPFAAEVQGALFDYGSGGGPYRSLFRGVRNYVRADVTPGPNVDRQLPASVRM